MRFTTLPFLMAMVMAIAHMPTDIYQICAWNHGTEQVEPWRTTISTLPAVQRLVLAATRLRAWLAELTDVPLLASEVGAVGNIKQLLQDEADNKAAIRKAKKEGRELNALVEPTPEQTTRLSAVLAELDALEAKQDTIDADLARARRLQDDERTAPSMPAIQLGADHATEAPVTLGQFLQGIAYTMTGKASQLSPAVQAAVSGASSGDPTAGGFLVRADWNTSLLDKMKEEGVLAPQCRTIPIGPESDGIEAPYVNETSRATGSRWGGVQVYRAAEAASVTASKPTLGKFELRLDDLMGLFYATDRLLRDTTALEAIAMDAFPSEFAFKLDDEILRGDGAGQCLGVLNSPALVTVAKENGQTAATIKAENIIKMYARMLASRVSTAKWYINQECLPQLQQMYVAIGTAGQLIYMPPNGLVDAPYGTLLGRPVVPIEQASGLGTVGDILFLSLARDYVLIDKPMTSASSEHVRFLFNEKTFKWVYPIIGRPKLQAAITPYKATTATTLSPFVALAAR